MSEWKYQTYQTVDNKPQSREEMSAEALLAQVSSDLGHHPFTNECALTVMVWLFFPDKGCVWVGGFLMSRSQSVDFTWLDPCLPSSGEQGNTSSTCQQEWLDLDQESHHNGWTDPEAALIVHLIDQLYTSFFKVLHQTASSSYGDNKSSQALTSHCSPLTSINIT